MKKKIYLLVLLVFVFIVSFLYTTVYHPEKIIGESMFPTIKSNTYILQNKLSIYFEPIRYNDIVIFYMPDRPQLRYIKRVVGLPGDKIEIKDKEIYRNGKLLIENYITMPSNFKYRERIIEVPKGYIYVLGDNRPESLDSRDLGPVPVDCVIAKAKYTFPSYKKFYKIKKLH